MAYQYCVMGGQQCQEGGWAPLSVRREVEGIDKPREKKTDGEGEKRCQRGRSSAIF